MDRSRPNVPVPRRTTSTFERTRQCLRNIANYLRSYRDQSVFQAVQRILRPVWYRQERNVSDEIEQEVYEALYRIVETIGRFQDTVQRATGRELGVDVEIPIFIPPAGTERAYVHIRLPIDRHGNGGRNREEIQIRFPERLSPTTINNISTYDDDTSTNDYDTSTNDYDLPPIHSLQDQDDEFYAPFLAGWARLYTARRHDGEDPASGVNFDDSLGRDGSGNDANVEGLALGEGIAGATEEEVERLVLATATDDHASQTCAVCLEEFEFNAPMRILPCEHAFHPNCIRSWLLRNPTCPIDRRNIFGDS